MRRASARVAVTGVGLVSALGWDREQCFSRVVALERGLSAVRSFDTHGMRTALAGEVTGLDDTDAGGTPTGGPLSRTDRLALVAAREAVSHARLSASALESAGLALGASTGAMFEAEQQMLGTDAPDAALRTAKHLFTNPISTTTERVASTLGIGGPTNTICTACSSGAVAMVQAVAWLVSGRANVVLAGGADGLCRMTFAGFNSLGALSPGGARPFDRNRDGLSLGEGAGFLVLETEESARSRDANVIAWLDGWAVAAEAHHITQPEASGNTASALLGRALATAGLRPEELGFVNAHGTGTEANDEMEAQALSMVLKEALGSTPVAASKGQLGHTLAAAGAIEAALCVLALERGVILACGGLETRDPKLGSLKLLTRAEPSPLSSVVCCSYGFGGTGCVLAFGSKTRIAPARHDAGRRIAVTAVASIGAGGRLRNEQHLVYAGADSVSPPARLAIDPLAVLAPERSRRFDRLTALSAMAVDDALHTAGRDIRGVGLCLGVAWFGIGRTIRFLERLDKRGARAVNPGEFPHLVPSSAAGNVSIYRALRGPVATVAAGATSASAALSMGSDLIGLGLARHMVVGASAEHEPLLPEAGGGPWQRSEGAAFLLLSAMEGVADSSLRPLALLDRVITEKDSSSGFQALPAPPSAQRARALFTIEGTERLLAASSWGAVPAVDVSRSAGGHEASEAFALATAVALIASGEVDRTLVVSPTKSAVRLMVFAAVEDRA